MITVHYPEGAPSVPPLAIALGFFDGVHTGHRRLIRETVRLAKDRGLSSAVFTFPSESGIKGDRTRLYSTEEKLRLIESLGVDYVILADFESVSDISAEDFVRDTLISQLNCRLAASGANFRFGSGARGDASLLSRIMKAEGKECYLCEDLRVDGRVVSTTLIREALTEGNTEYAARLLGEPYFISGVVERGLGLGHGFGFPTVNTALPKESPIKQGVYATKVKIDDKLYTGVTNVGECPTLARREVHLETMIDGFRGDLYGQTVTVLFIEYIREESVFPSPEALREQIYRDMEYSRGIQSPEHYY